jgi:hypothetical protein
MAICPDLAQEQERYVKLTADAKVLEQVFLDLFFVLCDNPPRRLFIDLDVTDDPVHGQQAMAFFNRYYDSVCYAPLYIFCGGHLLAAKLRPSNVDRRHRLDFKIQAERGGFARRLGPSMNSNA